MCSLQPSFFYIILLALLTLYCLITSPVTALGFFGPFQTSECMMPENAPVDTEVAELFTQDPDNPADTHTYTMTDNGGG